MTKYNDTERTVIKCAKLMHEELQPEISYPCETILLPIWEHLSDGDQQYIGKVFSKLVQRRAVPFIYLEVCQQRRCNVYRILN